MIQRNKSIQEFIAAQAQRRKKRAAKRRQLKMGPKRTDIKKEIDALTSQYVRFRDNRVFGGCLVCIAKRSIGLGSGPINNITLAYHIVSRKNSAVRWDLRNQVGACAPCNYGELMSRGDVLRQKQYRMIHEKVVGADVLAELEERALVPLKMSRVEMIEVRNEMRKKLEGVLVNGAN